MTHIGKNIYFSIVNDDGEEISKLLHSQTNRTNTSDKDEDEDEDTTNEITTPFFEFLVENQVGESEETTDAVVITIDIKTLFEWISEYNDRLTGYDFVSFASNICEGVYLCKECATPCYETCDKHGESPKLAREVDMLTKQLLDTRDPDNIIHLLCAIIRLTYYTADKRMNAGVLLSLGIEELEKLCPGYLTDYELFSATEVSNKNCVEHAIISSVLKYSNLVGTPLIERVIEELSILNTYIKLTFPNSCVPSSSSSSLSAHTIGTPMLRKFINEIEYMTVSQLPENERLEYFDKLCTTLREKNTICSKSTQSSYTDTALYYLQTFYKQYRRCILCEDIYYKVCKECNLQWIKHVETFIRDTTRNCVDENDNLRLSFATRKTICSSFKEKFGANITNHIMNQFWQQSEYFVINDMCGEHSLTFAEPIEYSTVEQLKNALTEYSKHAEDEGGR